MAGLSQEDLGERVGLSRFTIMRLEAGKQELRLDQARLIEPEIENSQLVDLVERYERLAEARRGAPDRDRGVRTLLERSGIHRVEVSLVDDLRLHEILGGNPNLANADVVVVVPTARREEQLFGKQLLRGHYEHELKRLTDLVEGPAVEIRESRTVLQPVLLVRASTGDGCVVWPLMFRDGEVDGAEAPVITSDDPEVIEALSRHFRTITRRDVAMPVHRNEALGVLDVARPDGDLTQVRFAGYAPQGEEIGEPPTTNVGFAVSLVIVHAIAPREGRPPLRRVVLYKRDNEIRDVGLWSLVSNHLDDSDIRYAVGADNGEWRSSQPPEDAAVRDGLALEQFDFRIPLRAFQCAAKREFKTMFGLDVEYERFKALELPNKLAQIEKATDQEPWRRPILPQVFSLELNTRPIDGPGQSELGRIRQSGVPTAVFGYEDLPSGPNELGTSEDGHAGFNDFLVAAGADGWLTRELKILGVTPK